MSDNKGRLLGAFLVRMQWDSGDEWYGERRYVEQFGDVDVIGVISRAPNNRIKGGESLSALKSEVDEKAVFVRWLDDPLPTRVDGDSA